MLFNPPLTGHGIFVACSDWVRRAWCVDHCASPRKLPVTASPDLGASDRARIETMLVTRSNEKDRHQRMIEQMLENLSLQACQRRWHNYLRHWPDGFNALDH